MIQEAASTWVFIYLKHSTCMIGISNAKNIYKCCHLNLTFISEHIGGNCVPAYYREIFVFFDEGIMLIKSSLM